MPEPDPDELPLDELRAHMDEVARRARGEEPRPVVVAPLGPTGQRVRDVRVLTAGASDDRPGLAGKATRLSRRAGWLARDVHVQAHAETVTVLEELDRRVTALERALAALPRRRDLERLEALVHGSRRDIEVARAEIDALYRHVVGRVGAPPVVGDEGATG